MNPAALLLGQAPWNVMGAVLDRLDDRVRDLVLARPPVPGAAVTGYVCGHGSVADRASLARNPGLEPRVLARLAHDRSPAVGAALYRHPRADRAIAVGVLTRADPEPDPGLVAELSTTRTPRLLYPLVESYDPALIRHAVTTIAPSPRTPMADVVVLRGCLNLWRRAGVDAVREALAATASAHAADATLVRDLLGDPSGRHTLGRVIETRGRTAELIGRIRAVGNADAVRLILLAPHEPLRWKAVRAEHEVRRLPRHLWEALAEVPDCPADLAALGAMPLLPSAKRRSGRVRRSPWRDVAGVDLANHERWSALRAAHLDGAIGAASVIGEGAPAARALAVFAATTGPGLDDARTVLAGLTGETLGADPDAWAVALTLLDEFVGTTPELVATARAVVG